MTMNLTAYTAAADGVELYFDNTTGRAFASQKNIALLCETSHTTIYRHLASDYEITSVKVPVAGGFVALYDEDAIFQCISKFNNRLVPIFAKDGLRVYLQGLAGFKVN